MPVPFLMAGMMPASWMILGMQGTQRMKKPHVCSAEAQKTIGAREYKESLSFPCWTVTSRRNAAATMALEGRMCQCQLFGSGVEFTHTIPMLKMAATPSLFCQDIFRVQMVC